MIPPVTDGSAGSIPNVLGSSNLVLLFSLLFKPAGRRNLFLNGYIALALGGTVHQVYDSKRLKADFLFSRMPVRDLAGPRSLFTHVYLCGRCETSRAVVYHAGVTAGYSALQQFDERIADDERRFRSSKLAFNLLSDNRSSIMAAVLESAGLVEERAVNRIPARLLKVFVRKSARQTEVLKLFKLKLLW